MLRFQAECINEEAQSKSIPCKVKQSEGIYWVILGEREHRWLSYWYASMDLWELEYKKEGVKI